MKRDLDLCREILQALEAHPDRWHANRPMIEGRPPGEVGYHLDLLAEAGLVAFVHRPGDRYRYGLTWAGHEFLDAARDNTRWNRAKRILAEKTGGLSFVVLQELLVSLSRTAVGL